MIDIYNDQDFRCTCFFNGWWLKACLAHDYRCSDSQSKQSLEMRFIADMQLRRDIFFSGTTKIQKFLSPIIAEIVYLGVSIHRRGYCLGKHGSRRTTE
jgi:hypothetical protein